MIDISKRFKFKTSKGSQEIEYVCYPPPSGDDIHVVKLVGHEHLPGGEHPTEAVRRYLAEGDWIPCDSIQASSELPEVTTSQAGALHRFIIEEGCALYKHGSLIAIADSYDDKRYIVKDEGQAEELLNANRVARKYQGE